PRADVGAGADRDRARLRPLRMGRARLEHARPRVLPCARRAAAIRVDRAARRRRAARRAREPLAGAPRSGLAARRSLADVVVAGADGAAGGAALRRDAGAGHAEVERLGIAVDLVAAAVVAAVDAGAAT